MKKRVFLGILACASIIALGLTGCKNTVDSAVKGIVSGYVLEAKTDTVDGDQTDFIPVEGATVTMGMYSATTDANGVWSISDVIPTGTSPEAIADGYTVVVTKDGYVAAQIKGVVVNAKEYTTADVDGKLAIADTLAASGDALETVTTTSTSASGVTSLYASSEILDALPSLDDIAYNYSISTVGVSLTPINCTASGTLQIATMDGTITNAPDDTVVQAYDTSKEYTYAETTVSDGTWAFDDDVLPANTATLTIVVPGFNAEIVSGETTTKYYFSSEDAASLYEEAIDTTTTPGTLMLAEIPSGSSIVNANIILNAQKAKPMVIATNVGSNTSPLELTDALTFTFDTAMDSVTAKDGATDLIVSLDDTKTIATVTSPDGTFSADFEIVLDGEVDGEDITLVKDTFNVYFNTFDLESVTVVDSVPTTARAVYNVSQYLALTFSAEVDTADIAAGAIECTTFIDGSTVYIPFIEIAQDTGVITGTVTSEDGLTSTNGTGLDNIWKLSAYTEADPVYVIEESNLSGKTVSIATANDSTTGIAPGESITFTFNKAFPEAVAAVAAVEATETTEAVEAVEAIAAPTVEVELYESNSETLDQTGNNINKTMLAATGTVSGNTVTIDPTNDLVAGTYYVSFTVKYDGKAIFTTANQNIASDACTVAAPYVTIPVNDPQLLTVHTKKYPEGVINVTQDADEIYVTFDSDITGYTAYMTTNTDQDGTSVDIESGAFVAKATVSGDTMTFDVDTLVAPANYHVYAYDANGDALTTEVTSFAVTDDDVAPTASSFTLSAPTNGTIGVDEILLFDIPLFTTANRNESYQLQKQTTLVDGTSEWTDCSLDVSVSIADKLAGTTETTLTETGIGADDDKYSTTITYRVVATVNNQEYVSNTREVIKD